MRRNDIVSMKPIRQKDGGITYIPVRQPTGEELDALPAVGELAPHEATREVLTGGYVDRAKGFSIKTWQLAALSGAGLYVIGKATLAYPWLSVAGVLILLAGMGAVWFAAFAIDLLLSPAGVAWYNSRRMWNHLDREQTERHSRYRRPNERQ